MRQILFQKLQVEFVHKIDFVRVIVRLNKMAMVRLLLAQLRLIYLKRDL